MCGDRVTTRLLFISLTFHHIHILLLSFVPFQTMIAIQNALYTAHMPMWHYNNLVQVNHASLNSWLSQGHYHSNSYQAITFASSLNHHQREAACHCQRSPPPAHVTCHTSHVTYTYFYAHLVKHTMSTKALHSRHLVSVANVLVQQSLKVMVAARRLGRLSKPADGHVITKCSCGLNERLHMSHLHVTTRHTQLHNTQ